MRRDRLPTPPAEPVAHRPDDAASPLVEHGLPLAWRLLGRLAPVLPDAAGGGATTVPEARWLAALSEAGAGAAADDQWAEWRARPPAVDAPLARLAAALALERIECAALALAQAADADPLVARALAWLQAPLREARPTLGLLSALDLGRESATDAGAGSAVATLLDGTAMAVGALELDSVERGASRADAALKLPQPLSVALAGGVGRWPGITLVDDRGAGPALGALLLDRLRRRAAGWRHGDRLVLASGDPAESLAAARALAAFAGARAAIVEGDAVPAGLLPWLLLHDAWPVLAAELAPGERRALPVALLASGAATRSSAPPWLPAVLVAGNADGQWLAAHEAVPQLALPLPTPAERAALWRALGHGDAAAQRLGALHRHTATRIAALHRRAQSGATEGRCGETVPPPPVVDAAARQAEPALLGALAQALPDAIADDALVLPCALRAELDALVERCRRREGLADGLGPAARARYRPGVRALFVGGSGTGKSLACGWLATRLAKPLYRVDAAAVVSKYIGETEKNLGELFARAEHADVVLMFDEADALFGRRTEVGDANDRWANQQTNYLLQRIEAFDGIALLTSNSRSRFDTAFTRRLDSIVEFTAPGPIERRALWLAHLGQQHGLSAADCNRLAAVCELAGGHIRNVVLAAMAHAAARDAPIAAGSGAQLACTAQAACTAQFACSTPVACTIGWADLAPALKAEYRKLGKPLPAALLQAGGGVTDDAGGGSRDGGRGEGV
jgi:hypothetical protein